MLGLYRKLWHNKDYFFFVLLTLVVCIAALFLQPKFSSFLFPYKRQQTLHQFLQAISTQRQVEPQAYWQFREFYSPGSFTFNPNYIDVGETFTLKKNSDDTKNLFFFSSPFLTSTDSVVEEGTLPLPDLTNKKVIFQDDKTLLYWKNDHELELIFVKPISEMRKANGFIDYTDQEQVTLTNFYWLNSTHIAIK